MSWTQQFQQRQTAKRLAENCGRGRPRTPSGPPSSPPPPSQCRTCGRQLYEQCIILAGHRGARPPAFAGATGRALLPPAESQGDGQDMTSLAGKIAWVTGAGSGIGEAAALALAEAGATVVLTGRRREPLEDVARRINASGTAHVQPADLTAADQVERVGDYIRTTFNRLDILVNNAGVNILERHWSQLTPERIDTLLQGNLTAALYCVTVALPFMRAQKDGVLIHTAS